MDEAQILVNLGARVPGVPAIPAEQGSLSEFNASNQGHTGVAGSVRVSVCTCGCAHTCTHLWVHTALLLIEPRNGKAAAMSTSLGQRSRSAGALGWDPVARQEEPSGLRAAGGSSCS